MTLDQLSNLVKDPKLFGILIVRPFGLLLQWLYSIVQNYGIAVIPVSYTHLNKTNRASARIK